MNVNDAEETNRIWELLKQFPNPPEKNIVFLSPEKSEQTKLPLKSTQETLKNNHIRLFQWFCGQKDFVDLSQLEPLCAFFSSCESMENISQVQETALQNLANASPQDSNTQEKLLKNAKMIWNFASRNIRSHSTTMLHNSTDRNDKNVDQVDQEVVDASSIKRVIASYPDIRLNSYKWQEKLAFLPGEVYTYEVEAKNVGAYEAMIQWKIIENKKINKSNEAKGYSIAFVMDHNTLLKEEILKVTISIRLEKYVAEINEIVAVEVVDGIRLFFYIKVTYESRFFGKSLSELEYISTNLANVNRSVIVPRVLDILKTNLLTSNGLHLEGVFRVNPTNSQFKETAMLLESNDIQELTFDNPFCIASLIKYWFRSLPKSVLFNFPIDKLVDGIAKETFLDNVNVFLDKQRQDLLFWLLDLIHSITSNQDQNLMTAENCCLVFAPNLFMVDSNRGPFNVIKILAKVLAEIVVNIHCME